ncbi:MAG: cytochrome P450 [Actinomycetota bacterium]|nr:cytochrome P450 [Actinomycetota bacterium]
MTVETPRSDTDSGQLHDVPGDGGLPLVGYTRQFISGELTTSRARYDKYGPVSWLRAFGVRVVTVQGPDACGELLQNRTRAFASGPGWSFLIGPFFRRGLMLLDLEEHHLHRRIMQEAFTSNSLRAYLEPMNQTLGAGLGQWATGTEFLVYPAIKQLTLDVATRTFMGADLGAEADGLNAAFADCVRAGTAALRFPVPGLRWSRGLAGRKKLEAFLYPQLAGKRADGSDDLFSALCHARGEDGEQFSDDDVINHMIFLLMAAHDTSTITLTTMAYYLAKHPEWQRRCRDESIAIGSPTAGFDDLDRLVGLDLVMREAMRLIPPVPGVMRKTSRDTELMGYFIPKDTYVTANLYGVHHLEEYWPDAQRFDPDRFSEGRREDKVHRNAWIPFGHGAHKCIGLHFAGMQIKAAMHQLLLRYQWSVPADYVMPIDWSSLPRPKDGLPIRLARH